MDDFYKDAFYCKWCGKVGMGNRSYGERPRGWYNSYFCSRRCAQEYSESNPSEGCFITTATCQKRHLPDDCHELMTLRAFRDTYMKNNLEMKAEVAEYYEIAPKICENISKMENSEDIYESIWQNHLLDAVAAVDAGENEKAHTIYKNMVLELKEKYLS